MTGNKVEMPSIINFKNTAKGDVDMLARSNSWNYESTSFVGSNENDLPSRLIHSSSVQIGLIFSV